MIARHGCTLQAVRWTIVDGILCAKCPVCGRIIAKETDGVIYWLDTNSVDPKAPIEELKRHGLKGEHKTVPIDDPVADEDLNEDKKNLLATIYFAYIDEIRAGYMRQNLGVLFRLEDAMRMLGASEAFMKALPPRC